MPRRKRTTEAGEDRPARLVDSIIRSVEQDLDRGENSIFTGAKGIAGAKDYISTQCLTLDTALNMPGIPVGRLTYIHGWESGGKTTIITHLLAETQRRGGVAALIDSEQAFDEERAADIGVNLDDLIFTQPETIEESVEVLEKLIKAIRDETPDALVLVAWDSVGGTPTMAEVEGDIAGGKAFGHHARVISHVMRRITPIVHKHNIALVIVNQNRELIQTGPMVSGDANTQIARRPLRFHASLELDVRKKQEVHRAGKKDSPAIGIISAVKVAKNKCSNPFGRAEFRITFDRGIDNNYSYLQAALKVGLVKQSGSWYAMSDYDSKFRESEFGQVLDTVDGLRERIETQYRLLLWPKNVLKRFMPDHVEEDHGDEDEGEDEDAQPTDEETADDDLD